MVLHIASPTVWRLRQAGLYEHTQGVEHNEIRVKTSQFAYKEEIMTNVDHTASGQAQPHHASLPVAATV